MKRFLVKTLLLSVLLVSFLGTILIFLRWGFLQGLAALAAWIGLAYFFSSICPNCYRFMAKRKVSERSLGQRIGFTPVTRTVEHKNSSGHVVGTSSHLEQSPYAEKYTKANFVCKFCGHEWTEFQTTREGGY